MPRQISNLSIRILLVVWATAALLAQPSSQAQQSAPPAGKSRPELVLQIGHVNEVAALAFSPDGETLASAGRDKTGGAFEPPPDGVEVPVGDVDDVGVVLGGGLPGVPDTTWLSGP